MLISTAYLLNDINRGNYFENLRIYGFDSDDSENTAYIILETYDIIVCKKYHNWYNSDKIEFTVHGIENTEKCFFSYRKEYEKIGIENYHVEIRSLNSAVFRTYEEACYARRFIIVQNEKIAEKSYKKCLVKQDRINDGRIYFGINDYSQGEVKLTACVNTTGNSANIPPEVKMFLQERLAIANNKVLDRDRMQYESIMKAKEKFLK